MKANPKADPKNALVITDDVTCGGCSSGSGCNGLVPHFTWEIDSENETLTVTPDSTLPSGETVAKTIVYVRQSSMDEWVVEEQESSDPVVIDLTVFDSQKDLQVRMRVVTTPGECIDYVDARIAAGWGQGNDTGYGDWELYPNH